MKSTKNAELTALYRMAAQQAHNAGISAADEKKLTNWIWHNCKFPLECLFWLVLGISCELADLQSREQGFINEVERAYFTAQASLFFPVI